MLQIISGRFFSGNGKLNEQEAYAVLYSNYGWIAPIKLHVGDFAPVGAYRSQITPFVLRYMNRYEQRAGDPMYLATDEDVTTQFRLLASFWFRAFFYPDRDYVELLCRLGPRTAQDTTVPRSLVPRFFDMPLRGTADEAAGFPAFVKQVVGLRRTKFNVFISCLGVFFDALEALGTNFDLAYSMYVYLLEALSQSDEGTPATWDDYDQKVKARLDEQLAKIDAGVATNIRDILVTSSHLRLTKRFIDFVLGHVEDSFFTTEAEQIRTAIPKSQFKRALENLYRTRSGYVHTLKELETALQFPPHVESADIIPARDDPFFTFSGLVRLCRHVLLSFLNRQEYVENEPDFPWRSEIPGTIKVTLAPFLWIALDGLTPKVRLGGFINQLVSSPESSPPDMRKVMEAIDTGIHGAKLVDRPAMLMLYWLWHVIMAEEWRRPKWQEFLDSFTDVFEKCQIETVAILLLLSQKAGDWPVNDLIPVLEKYQRTRYKPNELHLPLAVEVGFLADIANKFLAAGNVDEYKNWVERAIHETAGRKVVQDTLRNMMANAQPLDIRAIIGWPLPSMIRAASEETKKSESDQGHPQGETQEQSADKKITKIAGGEAIGSETGTESNTASAESSPRTQEVMTTGKQVPRAD